MKITYSAPGKVILSGEHAVVYGKPAIVAAIDKRLYFTISYSKKKIVDRNIIFAAQTVTQFLKKINKFTKNLEFEVEIKSNILQGRGLGSSAALAVAGSAAFLEFFSGEKFDPETINNLAFKIEKKFHQNPSGVDNTVSTFGGLIYFRREFEFLKSIFKLPFKIPVKIEKRLYLVDTGEAKESTAQMLSYVQSNEKIFNEIEKTTKRLTLGLVKEDSGFFEEAILKNQQLLEKLGVVSTRAKKILNDLKKFGTGKITGAGGIKEGAGFALFYAKDSEGLLSYLKSKKIGYFKFEESNIGALREK